MHVALDSVCSVARCIVHQSCRIMTSTCMHLFWWLLTCCSSGTCQQADVAVPENGTAVGMAVASGGTPRTRTWDVLPAPRVNDFWEPHMDSVDGAYPPAWGRRPRAVEAVVAGRWGNQVIRNVLANAIAYHFIRSRPPT